MNLIKIIKPFIYENKFKLIVYIICLLISYPLETIVIPKIFGDFFEKIRGTPDKQVYIYYFKLFLGILFSIGIIHVLIGYIDSIIIANFNESISNIIFSKILRFYENNYTDLELGKLVTRINMFPSILREITTDLFNWILPKVFGILIIIFYFFYIDYKLGFIVIGLLILLVIFNMFSFNTCIELSNTRYNCYEEKSEKIQDKLSNLYAIYAAGNIDNEIDNYKEITHKFKYVQQKSLSCSNTLKIKNTIFIYIIFCILCFYVVYLKYNNKIKNQDLITLSIIILYLVNSLISIANYLPDYTYHFGMITNISPFIDDVFTDTIIKPDINITDGKIVINHLTFKYKKNNKLIFDDFNLIINNGDKIAIIGTSGNGKSTLIKIIMGYYQVEDDMVFIDNQNINSHNIKSLRKQVSYINQNNKLFNTTIYENIKYGNTLTNIEIDYLFNKFNLHSIFSALGEEGFNTIVGVNGDQLSGGQKQIISLLRIYNKNNKILILDEPTSALDEQSKEIIINIIKQISIDCTLIIITHDDSNLELVDKVIRISNGKIVT